MRQLKKDNFDFVYESIEIPCLIVNDRLTGFKSFWIKIEGQFK